MQLKLIFHLQDRLLAWAAPRCGTEEWPSDSVALGVIDAEAGRICAVIVINARYGHMCSMHIASDGGRAWASRAILREIFTYAFHTLQHSRVNAVVAERDTAVLTMALKLGFVPEGRPRSGAADGSDAILLGMLAQECPWLDHEGAPHGQEVLSQT